MCSWMLLTICLSVILVKVTGGLTLSSNDLNNKTPTKDDLHNDLEPGDITTDVVIQTKVGQIQGLVVNSSGIITTRFLGIPYAQPPIEALRFQLPRKHPGWAISNALKATEYRFACPQDLEKHKNKVVSDVYRNRLEDVITSEDCLYLNVFIPKNLSAVDYLDIKSYSVMVYIHGGDFNSGSAIPYQGWRMAAQGNVIVIGIQYRLGVLGFLSTMDEQAPGNLGLWDQRQALHWIWDNIREFGGDPDTITLFGEGAGGVSVGYHVLSPRSRGLFVRAISQSGTVLNSCCPQQQPVDMARALATLTSCPAANNSDLVECLRQVPLDKLLNYSQALSERFGAWAPTIDNDFIPGKPLELIREGKFNWVDYIVGINNDVGYLLQENMPEIDFQEGISFPEFEAQIKQMTQQFYKQHNNGGSVDELYAAVLLEYASCDQTPQELARTLHRFYGDLHILSPSVLTARLMSRNDKRIYMYTFSSKGEQGTDSILTTGGDELSYIFGEVMSPRSRSLPSDQDKRLSTAVMDAWTNFAKTGNPNPVNDRGVNWRPFEEFTRHYIDFSLHMDASAVLQHPWPRSIAFWNDYVPYLMTGQRSGSHICRGQEVYSSLTRNTQPNDSGASIAMYTLAGLCVLLLCMVVVLGILYCVQSYRSIHSDHYRVNKTPLKTPIYRQQASPKRKYNGSALTDTETRKLHPLPYCEDI